MDWEAKLIKCVQTQLMFEGVLNHFKVLFQALNSTSSCEVEEIICLHLSNRLEGNDSLLIVDSWNFIDAIVEGDSLQSLRLSWDIELIEILLKLLLSRLTALNLRASMRLFRLVDLLENGSTGWDLGLFQLLRLWCNCDGLLLANGRWRSASHAFLCRLSLSVLIKLIADCLIDRRERCWLFIEFVRMVPLPIKFLRCEHIRDCLHRHSVVDWESLHWLDVLLVEVFKQEFYVVHINGANLIIIVVGGILSNLYSVN